MVRGNFGMLSCWCYENESRIGGSWPACCRNTRVYTRCAVLVPFLRTTTMIRACNQESISRYRKLCAAHIVHQARVLVLNITTTE